MTPKAAESFIIGLFFSVIHSSPAWSAEQNQTPIFLDGKDISGFVEYFQPAVKKLKKSVFVYNWSANAGSSLWSVERNLEDPIFAQSVRNASLSFWQNFGSPEGDRNSYGYGLYAAVDPVVTYGFGGGASTWQLIQLELPAGLRLIDIHAPAVPRASELTTRMQSAAEQFGCPTAGKLDDYFINGGKKLTPTCRKLIHEVFQNIFKIDAFAYAYAEVKFKACSRETWEGSRAFVITRSDWIKKELVRFYTEKTRGDLENRIRIQTLFIESTQAEAGKTSLAKLVSYLMAHPDSAVKSSVTKCSGATCIITAHLCDDTNRCEDLALDPILRAGGPTITQLEATETLVGKLLWADTDGQKKPDSIKTWLTENKFACDGNPAYEDDGGQR